MYRAFLLVLALVSWTYAAGGEAEDCYNDDTQLLTGGGRHNDLEPPPPAAVPATLRITPADVAWLLEALRAAREASAKTDVQP